MRDLIPADETRPTATFALEPLDLLLFRDGHPFDAGGRASTGLPGPQTLAGALTSALLEAAALDPAAVRAAVRQTGDLAGTADVLGPVAAAIGRCRFLGPLFEITAALPARTGLPARGLVREILLPLPAHLRRAAGTGAAVPLLPLRDPLPGWSGSETPLWLRSEAVLERPAGFVALSAVAGLLRGEAAPADGMVAADEVFGYEDRTGIAIDRERATASEGALYGVRFLALRPGVRLVVEVGFDGALQPLIDGLEGLLSLGGERRSVRIEGREAVAWPTVAPGGDGRFLWTIAPSILPQGNRLTEPASLAAAVSGYRAISGWDLARGGPKPNRFAAEAGSVFFLPDLELPARGGLGRPEDVRLGWGGYLRGNWCYA